MSFLIIAKHVMPSAFIPSNALLTSSAKRSYISCKNYGKMNTPYNKINQQTSDFTHMTTGTCLLITDIHARSTSRLSKYT